MRFALPFGLVVLLIPCPVGAWIYPEHRDILALALSDLRADQRQLFLELWADARRGRESRYCATVVDGDGRSEPACIDLAAWAGIAGDHSCSPELLLSKTLASDWILKVAKVSAETKVKFEKATGREAKQNAAAINNLKLQFVDKEYTTRAGANNGHFLTTRTSDDSKDYLVRTLGAEAEPNALGLYLYYHLGALGLVRQWAAETDPAARTELARKVLATEAFAIHFLEDTFAAGHVAGSWGDVAERKGTHDYYSEFGLDTSAWNGTHFTLLGDGYMRPEDLKRTAGVVALSSRADLRRDTRWDPFRQGRRRRHLRRSRRRSGLRFVHRHAAADGDRHRRDRKGRVEGGPGDADPRSERERRPRAALPAGDRPLRGLCRGPHRRTRVRRIPVRHRERKVVGRSGGRVPRRRRPGGAHRLHRAGQAFSVSDSPTTRPSRAARSQPSRRLELRSCPPGRDSPSACACRSTSSPSICFSQPRS